MSWFCLECGHENVRGSVVCAVCMAPAPDHNDGGGAPSVTEQSAASTPLDSDVPQAQALSAVPADEFSPHADFPNQGDQQAKSAGSEANHAGGGQDKQSTKDPAPGGKVDVDVDISARRAVLFDAIKARQLSPATAPSIVWLMGETSVGKSWLTHRIEKIRKRGFRNPKLHDAGSTLGGDLTIFEIDGGLDEKSDTSLPKTLFIDIAGESVKSPNNDLFKALSEHADAIWYVVSPKDEGAYIQVPNGKWVLADCQLKNLIAIKKNFNVPVLVLVSKADEVQALGSQEIDAPAVIKWIREQGPSVRMKGLPDALEGAGSLQHYSFGFIAAYPGGSRRCGIRIWIPATGKFVSTLSELGSAEMVALSEALKHVTWKSHLNVDPLPSVDRLCDDFLEALKSQTSQSDFGMQTGSPGSFSALFSEGMINSETLTADLDGLLAGKAVGKVLFQPVPPVDALPSRGVISALEWTRKTLELRRDGDRSKRTEQTRALGNFVLRDASRPFGVAGSRGRIAASLFGMALMLVGALWFWNRAESQLKFESSREIVSLLGGERARKHLETTEKKDRLLDVPDNWYGQKDVKAIRSNFSKDLLSNPPNQTVVDIAQKPQLVSYPIYRRGGSGFVVGQNSNAALDFVPWDASSNEVAQSLLGREMGTTEATLVAIDRTALRHSPSAIQMRAYNYIYAIALYRQQGQVNGNVSGDEQPDQSIKQALDKFETDSKKAMPADSCAVRSSVAQLISSHAKFRGSVSTRSAQQFAKASAEFLKGLKRENASPCGTVDTLTTILDFAFEDKLRAGFADYSVNPRALRDALVIATLYSGASGERDNAVVKIVERRVTDSLTGIGKLGFWFGWREDKPSELPSFPNSLLGESLVRVNIESPTRTHTFLSALDGWAQSGLTSIASVESGKPDQLLSEDLIEAVQPLIWQSAEARLAGEGRRLLPPEIDFLNSIRATKFSWANVARSGGGIAAILLIVLCAVLAAWIFKLTSNLPKARAVDLFLTPRYREDA